MIQNLAIDFFFSALAGMGFGVIFNPPHRVLLLSGLFAGIGHSFRLYLISECNISIFVATFLGAFVIGILGFLSGRLSGRPAEIFSFPAVLPMIPGLIAYKAILSIIKLLSEKMDMATTEMYMMSFLTNGITALSILFAIVMGACTSVFIDTLSSRIESRKLKLRLNLIQKSKSVDNFFIIKK